MSVDLEAGTREQKSPDRRVRAQTADEGAPPLSSSRPSEARAGIGELQIIAFVRAFLSTDLGSPIPDLRCAASGMTL